MKSAIRNGIVSAAAITVLGMASAASASVIAYEGFTGGSGSITAQSSSEGTGWNGGWTVTPSPQDTAGIDGTIVTPGTSGGVASPPHWASPNSNEPVTNFAGNLAGTATASGDVYRSLGSSAVSAISNQMSTGGKVFLSFLVQRQDTNTRGLDVELLGGGIAGTDELLVIGGKGAAVNPSNWGLLAGGNAGGGVLTSSTVSSASESTFLMVAEIDYGGSDGSNSTVELYINPTGTTAPTATQAFTNVNMSAASIDTVRLFSGGITASGLTSTDFGEVYIGTTFADVVPEPSCLALAGVSLAGLLARRRRALA